ncbi:O-acetylserine/cysteine efflux transporter [Prauserella halophila]|nr:O-acetylserine/cysteine efflux transporter [Prauserella halophila]
MSMLPRDRLLAAFVAVVWGCNFLAIHATLTHFPPLFAGALRFLVIAIPTMLLIPRPKVKARWLIGYGLGFGTLQFAFLFVGMYSGMPTGLASLVLQSSAPFTVLLGAVLLRERLSRRQLAGIALAIVGMAAIAWQRAEYAALLPVILTLLGGLSWAAGNLCSRQAKPDNSLHFTLWMSVVPPLPMFALSLVFEGPARQWRSLATIDEGWIALAGLGYIVLLGTILGSGIWTTLMRRNPASSVAPFSLLVPVVGMTLSFLLLDERPTPVEIAAAVVVVVGVFLGSTTARLTRGRGRDRPPEPAVAAEEPDETQPGVPLVPPRAPSGH